jgi:hypothetical protein
MVINFSTSYQFLEKELQNEILENGIRKVPGR